MIERTNGQVRQPAALHERAYDELPLVPPPPGLVGGTGVGLGPGSPAAKSPRRKLISVSIFDSPKTALLI
jgi:hypothetical protein